MNTLAEAIRARLGDDAGDVLEALGLVPYRRVLRTVGYDNRNITWRTAPPGGRGVPRAADAVAERRARYAELIGEGMSTHAAARELGIHPRTARRYNRALAVAA